MTPRAQASAERAATLFAEIVTRTHPDQATLGAYLDMVKAEAQRQMIAELIAAGRLTPAEADERFQAALVTVLHAAYQQICTTPASGVVHG